MPLPKGEPFIFKTQLSLVLLTGLKASDLFELGYHLKMVPESSIYYHTHHFLQQHQYMTPEPPNDFAYWVTQVLSEDRMGEKLAAIDTVRFTSLQALRLAIVRAIDDFLEKNPVLRKAPHGEEFYFMKSTLFNLPTVYKAHTLAEFLECLKKVSIQSLYYHVFEGRLRTEQGTGDFSNWLTALGEEKLAKQMDRLDPYTHTMEGLRSRMIRLIEQRLTEVIHAA